MTDRSVSGARSPLASSIGVSSLSLFLIPARPLPISFVSTTIAMACLVVLVVLISTVYAQRPTCPNGQIPKLDSDLNPIQCLPGTTQHAICGPNHNCYFTGLNYMCCPSNEPSVDNQPQCPYPKLTVLNSHGLPMKCSSRTRQCPSPHMTCNDVGLGFICCENPGQSQDFVHSGAVVRHSTTTQKPTTTVSLPEDELECPANSLGLLSSSGRRVVCNSRKRCPGKDTFCHGGYKRSICCQRYLFAKSILEETTTLKPVSLNSQHGSFVESRSPFRPKSISVALRKPGQMSREQIEQTAQVEDQIAINSVGVRRSGPRPQPHLKPSEEIVRTWRPSSLSFRPSTTTTTTTTTTTPKVPAAVTGRLNSEFREPTIQLPSETMNNQDRQAIAQQLIQYQIQNGWPYDERFYRPDAEIYNEKQKAEIARMRFLPN